MEFIMILICLGVFCLITDMMITVAIDICEWIDHYLHRLL